MNRTELAVLGLLALEPKSGYEIKRQVEDHLSYFWSTSYGQLYPVLRRLAERDLLAKERIPGEGRPDRYVYSLTADGWSALRDELDTPVEFPKPRNELLLRLFLGEFGPSGPTLDGVRSYREHARGARAALEAAATRLEASDEPEIRKRNWVLGARFGVMVMRAIEDWTDLAESTLEPSVE